VGSATDPLKDTAKPVNQVGGISVKMYFRKGRKCQTGGGNRRVTNRGNSTVRGAGGAPWWSRQTPKGSVAHGVPPLKGLQPMDKHTPEPVLPRMDCSP